MQLLKNDWELQYERSCSGGREGDPEGGGRSLGGFTVGRSQRRRKGFKEEFLPSICRKLHLVYELINLLLASSD